MGEAGGSRLERGGAGVAARLRSKTGPGASIVTGRFPASRSGTMSTSGGAVGSTIQTPAATTTTADRLPGMPPVLDPNNLYAADGPGRLSRVVRGFRPLVYVPNSKSSSVDVIDPETFRIVRHFAVGRQPQHVSPSWDLRRLWVGNGQGDSLTPIDPRTGTSGRSVPVQDPYNLYFTPDGRFAIVVAERLQRLDFRDPIP
jgi:DNA-binding beta-propeller fold protein YncE